MKFDEYRTILIYIRPNCKQCNAIKGLFTSKWNPYGKLILLRYLLLKIIDQLNVWKINYAY